MLKRIGKEVLFSRTSSECPRNGEGSFLRLKDGSILFAYSRYCGGTNDDHAPADIYGIYSMDEGETWHRNRMLVSHEKEANNYMSVSLLRMKNGDIGMFFVRTGKDNSCVLMMVRSADEGETWTIPTRCILEDGYFVVNNDRVIRLASGRILFPANYHRVVNGELDKGVFCTFASDDDGITWHELPTRIESPFPHVGATGLQESGLYQFPNGRIWSYSRTDLGMQYECFSDDEGVSWSKISPNKLFTSPASPMLVKRVGKYTVAVFNPIPWNCTKNVPAWGGRTPLACAVSENEDVFVAKDIFLLEDDPLNEYCYPAIIEVEGGFLVAYYHSDGSGLSLKAMKIIKVLFDEIVHD